MAEGTLRQAVNPGKTPRSWDEIMLSKAAVSGAAGFQVESTGKLVKSLFCQNALAKVPQRSVFMKKDQMSDSK